MSVRTHGWQVEWLTLPQMVMLTGGALKHARIWRRIYKSMRRRCLSNITRANDVILAEAAVFALAKAMPRAQAEELVKKACAVAVSENKSLIESSRSLPAIRLHRSTGKRWRSRKTISARPKKLSTECSRTQLEKEGGFSNPPKDGGHECPPSDAMNKPQKADKLTPCAKPSLPTSTTAARWRSKDSPDSFRSPRATRSSARSARVSL